MKGLREVRSTDRIFSAILSIGVLCLMVVGCIPENIELPGSSSSVPLDTIVSPDVPPILEVSVPDGAVNYFVDGVSFERVAGEISVVFRTEEDWTVKVVDAVGHPVTWCRLSSALGGAGLHNVKISVDENMGKSSRTARVVLMAFEDASKVAVIEVSQEGTALFLERTHYEVSPSDTTIAVELKSNVDFEYSIAEGVDWLRESPASSRALTAHAMAFAVDANPSYRSREARVFFHNTRYDITDTLTLVQQGLTPTLTVPEEYTDYFTNGLVFDNSAGETEVVFCTNIYWTMQIVPVDGDDVSWCSVDTLSGGAGLHKLKVRTSRNESYSHRSAVLCLMCDAIPLGEIQVTQNQENAILLGQREYQVSCEATEVEVTLSTNVAFEYTILGGDWLRERQSATRGLTAHRLVFEIDANPSNEQREAKIVFHNSEYEVSDTLMIVQFSSRVVDLGLSVKWATCNVGADSPEDYGGYYAWGETDEKSDYQWTTYKWCEGTSKTLTRYCTKFNNGTFDGRTKLDLEDDVAHIEWDDNWRMPTLTEIEELINNCTWEWTIMNGVRGHKVTGPNANYIFLPVAGYRYGTDVYGRGSLGFYWSATLYEDDCSCAYYLYFGSVSHKWNSDNRSYGYTVRPVTE